MRIIYRTIRHWKGALIALVLLTSYAPSSIASQFLHAEHDHANEQSSKDDCSACKLVAAPSLLVDAAFSHHQSFDYRTEIRIGEFVVRFHVTTLPARGPPQY